MSRFAELPGNARALILVVCALGGTAVVIACAAAPPPFAAETLVFVGLAIAGGLVRIPLPGFGHLSFAYPFLFASLMAYGLGTSSLAAILSAAAASLAPVRRRWQPLYRGAFNVGVGGLAATACGGVYLALGGVVGAVSPARDMVPILAYTAAFSFLNVGLVSLVTRLTRTAEQPAQRSFRASLVWSLPGFLAGSALATLLGLLLQQRDLSLLLLAAPFVYLMDLAYRERADRADQARRHSEQTAELYQAVTRALARAIEAKDENTENHLQRVQQFCLGIAEKLGLSAPEIEALRAASVLHDIGKIGIPEYILTKPGRLSPEEMERMRIHPRVGAEILSAVPFPYPLAPIVRHHHERWDGNGYPDRLAGEAIPLGARILSVVDCYDALTTDRPYRKAVGRDEALDYLRRESGRIFDASLVGILAANVEQLEARVRSLRPSAPVERTPLAGGAHARAEEEDQAPDSLPLEERARAAEVRTLQDIARTVSHQLDPDETLTLMAAKLARLVPFRSLAVYLFDEERATLVPCFTSGTAAGALREVRIPVGERLSGWAALHQRAYIGRAHVDPLERDGSRSDLEDLSQDPDVAELASAVVAPLSTEREQLGVLALYDRASQVYTEEQRRLLVAAATHVAQAVRNASRSDKHPFECLTDAVTGLPNWRFYFLEADQRLMSVQGEDIQDLGLLAFRVHALHRVRELYGTAACDRMLGEIARRLARECTGQETLVRMGGDLFLILTGEGRSRALSARCLDFLRAVQTDPIELIPQVQERLRLRVTQAVFPSDGRSPDQLLHALEERFEAEAQSQPTFPAFPEGRWSSLGVDS